MADPVHYVKFLRGTIAAYESLKTAGRLDSDTLYFVYTDSSATRGKLYLGEKLINGSEGGSIEDLNDIEIDGSSLTDAQILAYDESTQTWRNTELAEIIGTAISVMSGATVSASGAAGLVPQPSVGDSEKFLRGDGTWATPVQNSFDMAVFVTNANEVSLKGFASASVGTLPVKTSSGLAWVQPNSTGISRQIISLSNLQTLVENEEASENVIYMVETSRDSSSSDRYDEYMVISNQLERIGNFGQVDLSGYVTTISFNTAVGSLSSRITALESATVMYSAVGDLSSLILTSGNTTLVEEINTINERLTWQEI